jgi:hypothetical protein
MLRKLSFIIGIRHERKEDVAALEEPFDLTQSKEQDQWVLTPYLKGDIDSLAPSNCNRPALGGVRRPPGSRWSLYRHQPIGASRQRPYLAGRASNEGDAMRRIPFAITLLVVLTCVSVLVEPPGASGQNTKSIRGTYLIGEQLSSNTVYPGDVPKHEVVQFVRRDVMKSADPDFNFECTLYEQADAVAGTGSHRGHSNCGDKSGNRAFFTYEGVHKTVALEGGRWEVPFEGKFRWTGGTGKFKTLKGVGTYRGKGTPEEGFVSYWEMSGVEY